MFETCPKNTGKRTKPWKVEENQRKHMENLRKLFWRVSLESLKKTEEKSRHIAENKRKLTKHLGKLFWRISFENLRKTVESLWPTEQNQRQTMENLNVWHRNTYGKLREIVRTIIVVFNNCQHRFEGLLKTTDGKPRKTKNEYWNGLGKSKRTYGKPGA